MASITSTATGNWATGGTWVGGVAPGDGDTAIIANGHTVTIAASTSVTVGDSANPTTPAISSNNSNGTGILIVGAGATLTVKGNVRQGNANWTINAGATINFLHATANLKWQFPDDGATATNSKLIMSGSSGSRITVQSTGAANCGGFGNTTASEAVRGGMLQATFVSFDKIGTSTLPFLTYRADASYVGYLDDCLVTNSGKWVASRAATAGATIRFRRTTFRSPISSDLMFADLELATGTHSNVVIDGVRAVGRLRIWGQVTSVGIDIDDLLIESSGSTEPVEGTSAPVSVVADLMMIHNKIAAGALPSRMFNGTYTRLMSHRTGQGTSGNGHAMTIDHKANTSITGGIWEFGENDDSGDALQVTSGPSTSKTLLISGIIMPPCPDGSTSPGAFVNVSGASANSVITVEHNTNCVSSISGGSLGDDFGGSVQTESTGGTAGVIAAVRDNIMWRPTSGAGYVVYYKGTPADGTFVGADYNCRYNLTSDGYAPTDAKFSTPSPPGPNDITANPTFVDSTRNLLTWGQSINGSLTTRQQVIDELMKKNDDSGYNSAFTLAAYYAYMQAGFTPTNAALKSAGHDGSDIGAVAVVSGQPTSKRHGGVQYMRLPGRQW